MTEEKRPSGGDPVPTGPCNSEDRGHHLPMFRLFSFFLPETSILRRFRFQLVVASRFLSEIGKEGIGYGAIVQAARNGSPFQASMLGVAKMLPGALLGLFGGAVADALPRRVALGLGYALQAGLCVVMPVFFGTGFGVLFALVLASATLNQFIGPSEKAVIPLVSKREEISTAASVLSLTDSVATGLSTAAIAPLVLVAFGLKPLFFICAGFLALASVRIFALPVDKDVTVKAAMKRLRLSDIDLGFTKALSWLLGWPAIVTIIMAGMLVSAMNSILRTLGPSYVSEVLHADPAKTVYVFAPAGIGALIALATSPWVINKTGERAATAVAVLVMSIALFAMAFMRPLAPVLSPLSPVNVVRLFGFHPTDALLGASFLAIFIGLAVSMSSVSVQTYVNRRVPLINQGRVFGMQSVLGNAAALVPMVSLGFLAEQTSIQAILFFAPWAILGTVYALLVLASRWTGIEPMNRRQVLDSFWHEPEGQPPAGPASSFAP